MLESIAEHPIYTVSQLNQEVRALLEYALPFIWLEGEVSNLRAPGSGHLYFSLKDTRSQIRCALFRSRSFDLGSSLRVNDNKIKDGMHVLVRARVSLYEERGDFQLIIEHLEEIGDGALRRAFEALKQTLNSEGLFDSAHKKALPKWPSCVGVITSHTGAAIRDILSVLKRRYPGLPVVIYPSSVQGAQAADQIVSALHLANRRKECDVLILGRGGGSLEDLWPFNEERVARAIYESEIPIVTGIGHEIDFTIADFVADQRAATPSAAAELISPDRTEWMTSLLRLQMQLTRTITQQFQHTTLLLNQLEKRLPHPRRRIEEQIQKLDGFTLRLSLAEKNILSHLREKLNYLMQGLDDISPLNTLKRGYAIVTHHDKILQNAADVQINDQLNIRLKEGSLGAVVSWRTTKE